MRAAVFAIGVVAGLAACPPPPRAPRAAIPTAGLTVSLYRVDAEGYGVVDDRRWVEVTDGTLALEHVDPTTPLASLLVEPLGDDGLAIGACTRDTRPAIHCAVTGPRGRHLVRVMYVASELRYVARHQLAMHGDDKVSIASRFVIATPAWGRTAQVTLFDGLPGRDAAPREVARGEVTLDGSTAIIASPAREVGATLRRIYAVGLDEEDTRDASHGSSRAVWVYLDMEVARLPAGQMNVVIDSPSDVPRDLELYDAVPETTATRTRVPLWIDPELSGARVRVTIARGDADLRERYTFTVTNNSDTAREVWVEQRLRDAKHRSAPFGTPKPTLGTKSARVKLAVPAKQQARADFGLAYAF